MNTQIRTQESHPQISLDAGISYTKICLLRTIPLYHESLAIQWPKIYHLDLSVSCFDLMIIASNGITQSAPQLRFPPTFDCLNAMCVCSIELLERCKCSNRSSNHNAPDQFWQLQRQPEPRRLLNGISTEHPLLQVLRSASALGSALRLLIRAKCHCEVSEVT